MVWRVQSRCYFPKHLRFGPIIRIIFKIKLEIKRDINHCHSLPQVFIYTYVYIILCSNYFDNRYLEESTKFFIHIGIDIISLKKGLFSHSVIIFFYTCKQSYNLRSKRYFSMNFVSSIICLLFEFSSFLI